uniref:Uncharacterized protein n=1 Tax=Romanomermis culicivorax TaxID=13658 RepID=A0A915IT90_ROMCU
MPDDFLQVYDGIDAKGVSLHPKDGYNGAMKPPSYLTSRSGRFYLIFRSNPTGNAMGWNITFSTNCPVWKAPPGIALNSNSTSFGSEVTVSCPRGYEFVNGQGPSFKIICGLGGRWSENRIPGCQPRYCSPVPQIPNGFAVSATNVTYGGVAKYQCYQGFSFPSSKQIEEIYCSDEGRWSSPPTCKAKTCPALPSFVSGHKILLYGDGTGYGTVYHYECNPGYFRIGTPTLLCQTNGQWSSDQPYCQKLQCFDLPQIKNGVILNADKQYFYEDSTKVVCRSGFRPVGSDTIRCLANQTFSSAPECRDIDECAEVQSGCSVTSTRCENMPGGFQCRCLSGYEPQLACTVSNPLGLSTGLISGSKISVSSEKEGFPASNMAVTGWCAINSATVGQKAGIHTFTITLDDPFIIERIRLEKVGQDMKKFTTRFSLKYASDVTDPVKIYTDVNGT